MAGPIVFASDGPVDDKGPTEFGGAAGLVQGGDHLEQLTGSEKRGILVRAQAVVKVDAKTGLASMDESADAVDPVTGIAVDPKWNEDGGAVKSPVALPLKTAPPTADVV